MRTCGNMSLLGDKEEQKLSSVAPSESLKAKTISDLWTSNPVQFSVVECKDGGAAADVALLLLMWRPPNCWALPYGSYCQPRGSGQSWLMLGDTTNVDSLLMWILPIILMWTPLIPFRWISVIRTCLMPHTFWSLRILPPTNQGDSLLVEILVWFTDLTWH